MMTDCDWQKFTGGPASTTREQDLADLQTSQENGVLEGKLVELRICLANSISMALEGMQKHMPKDAGSKSD